MAESQSRRLAAILAADIAGYSALVGADEEGTVRALKGHQAVVLPMVGQHGGRVIDTAGDGIMAEFASVLAALNCALAIQGTMAERNIDVPAARKMQFRIGINLGDVIFDETRIYGDGINVAARLEGLAEPGGICVSATVHEHCIGKIECGFDDLGEQALKNIARPVRAYRVRSKLAARPQTEPSMLTLPDKPSIAVLPFTNMSGDPEQEYFSDGIAEDILTELSRMRWLFVTARNSSFTYKGKAVDVKQVSRELGVRYVLEGSVRKAGNRVRVTGQLIDATTGNHVWAERYDRELADIFSVQEDITKAVVMSIAPAISEAEMQRSLHKRPESLSAWEAYHRGVWHWAKHNRNDLIVAQEFFKKALSYDVNFSQAYSALSGAYQMGAAMFGLESIESAIVRAEPLARQAIALDVSDAQAHARLALVLFNKGQLESALREADYAIRLSPDNADAVGIRGASLIFSGRTEEGRTVLDRYFVLSPFDVFLPVRKAQYGISQYMDRDYARAAVTLGDVVRQFPSNPTGHSYLAAALGQLGQIEKAALALRKLEEVAPHRLRRERRPFYSLEHWAHFMEGVRKAGWNDTVSGGDKQQ